MTNPRTQLEVGVDSTESKQGFAEIEASARGMATTVAKEGQRAAKGLDGIGAGGEAASQKMDRTTSNIVASVKRATAALESGGTSTRKYYETIAAQRGVSADVLRPYLDQLDAAKRKQDELSASTGGLTESMVRMGAVAGATAFAYLIKGAIDSADGLNDLRKSTGLTVETLAGLTLASKQSGAELEGTAQAINKLSVNVGKNAEKFAALGITAKDPIEAFKQLADIFKGLDDPQQRAALGAEALGKSWASAAPLLAEGSANIQTMIDRGTELSGVTQGMADSADQFNDAMAEMTAKAGGIASQIAGGLLPVLIAATENTDAFAVSTGGLNDSFSPITETLRAAIVLAGNVAFVFKAVGAEIGGISAQIALFASGEFSQAADIGRQMTADAEDARAAFDKWEAGVLGAANATAKATEETKKLSAAQKAAVEGFIKPADSQGGTGRASSSARVEVSDYEKLVRSIREKIAAQGAERTSGQQLTEAEKLRVKIVEQIASGAVKMTAAQRETVLSLVDGLKVGEQALAQDRERAKVIEAWTKEYEKSASQLDDQIAKQEEANEVFGLSAEAAARLTASKLELAAATEEARAAQLRENAAYAGGMYDEYMREADAIDALAAKRRELARGVRTGADKSAADEARKAAEEGAKAADQAWQKTADSIEQTLTDALMRGFEGGKGFAENFGDSIVNMLKTKVATSISGTITDAIMSAAQGQSGSGGGAGSMLSSLGTAWSYGKNLYSMYSTASAAGSVASAATSASQAAQTAYWLKAGQAGYGSIAGAATPSASGASAGMSGASVAGIWAAAIAAAIALNSKYEARGYGFQTMTTGERILAGGDASYRIGEGLKQIGVPENWANTLTGGPLIDRIWNGPKDATAGYGLGTIGAGGSFASSTQDALGINYVRERGGERVAQPYVDGLANTAKSIELLAQNFGGNAGGVVLGAKTSADGYGKRGISALSVFGKDKIEWNSGDNPLEDLASWMQKEMPKVLLAGLSQSDLEPKFKTYFSQFADKVAKLSPEDANAIVALAEQAKQVYAVFGSLEGALSGLKNVSVEAANAFVGSFGGAGEAAQAIGSYRAAVWSGAEQQAFAQEQLAKSFAALGQVVPATDAAYRSLVEGLDLSTDAGRTMYQQLVNLAPAFAQITDAAAASAASIAQAAAQLASSRRSLEIQIMDAAGNSAAATAAKRADEIAANSGVADLLKKLYDTQDATAASDYAKQIAGTSRGLEIQIMEAMGNSAGALAARRSDELAAADPALQPILKKLYAEQDAAAARAQAAQAEQAAAAAASAAADAQRQAQDALRQGWQTIADSIAQTVRDLRDELQSPTQSYAARQAEFAIATAAARAGDQSAAQQLPTLAKALVESSKAMSSTAAEQAIATAQTLASLEATVGALARYGITIPKFASGGSHSGGLRMVGENGPELEATGPSQIYSNAQLRSALQGNDLSADMRAVVAELAALRAENGAENRAIAAATTKTARILDRVTPDGDAVATRAAL